MNEDSSVDDGTLRQILRSTRTIAMVGASPSPHRDSHGVMKYLQASGYRVIPVNPTALGQRIHGERVVATLTEIGEPFELVDVFRRPDAVPGIVESLLPLIEARGIRTLWLQLGVGHAQAAARARKAGLAVVAERCIKVEHRRLSRAGAGLSGGGSNDTGVADSGER